MTRDDALGIDGALEVGDVSRALSISSSAVEAALYQFSGGPRQGSCLGSKFFCGSYR